MDELIEIGLFERFKFKYLNDTHPMRENSHLIDEMLLMDHETSKFLEESMFEGNQFAVKFSFLFSIQNFLLSFFS